MRALSADVVLWPVWCDYPAGEWNRSVKLEYAGQAGQCGTCVLLVNPCCKDPAAADAATGGAVWFRNKEIVSELPAGTEGVLLTEIR